MTDHRTLTRVLSLLNSKTPTRLILVTETCPFLNHNALLKVALIPSDFPFVVPVAPQLTYSNRSVEIILALNRESMLIDPINWERLSGRMREWGKIMCPNLTIIPRTDHLFGERTRGSHNPRYCKAQSQKASSIYQFFDPESPIRHELDHLLSSGVPVDDATLINKINKHERSLSLLGILPNPLRLLLKKYTKDADTAFIDISKTLFWQGYTIWKTRKELNRKFWKEIAPTEWKLNKTKKLSKKKLAEIKAAELCTNPFHYLKKHANFTDSKPTPRLCYRKSKENNNRHEHQTDIRVFFPTLSSLTNTLPRQSISREDLIRGAHDRGKKRDPV